MTPFHAANYGVIGFELAIKPQKGTAREPNGIEGVRANLSPSPEFFREPTPAFGRGVSFTRRADILERPGWIVM